MVVPTHGENPGANQMAEYPEDGEEENNYDGQEAEPLGVEHRKQAQPLIDEFGEDVVRKLFSSIWKLREEGLIDLEDMIINKRRPNKDEAFVNGVGAVRFTIQDKMAGVS